jgi:hydrogenase expression/formation protein HypC
MCLALPRRVLQVTHDRVEVEWDHGPLWVSAAGFPDLAVGEHVLVHAGQVLERVSDAEAEEILALYASLEQATLEFASTASDSATTSPGGAPQASG